MSPTEFRRILDRFYDAAAKVLHEHEAILDKFVGDEAVAIFIPALSGDQHAARAVAAGRALLRATGYGTPGGPWVPIGIGVHTGIAFVGAVGEGASASVTALGDIVNVAARLASAAGPGELLVTAEAARAAQVEAGERRELELRGKSERVPVVVCASRKRSARLTRRRRCTRPDGRGHRCGRLGSPGTRDPLEGEPGMRIAVRSLFRTGGPPRWR